MFEYIDTQIQENADNAKILFRILQKVFEKSIMLTHRSKYTQFLLLYICHFDPSFVERYLFATPFTLVSLADWSTGTVPKRRRPSRVRPVRRTARPSSAAPTS